MEAYKEYIYFRSRLLNANTGWIIELKATTLSPQPKVSPTASNDHLDSNDTRLSKTSSISGASTISGITNHSLTPHPSVPNDSTLRPGLLSVHISQAKEITLPPGISRPSETTSHSSSLLTSSRNNTHFRSKSLNWHLPYIVLEFDKNQIIVDGQSGELELPNWNYTGNFDVSRESQLSVQVYLRMTPPSSRQSSVDDAYLGGFKINPLFDENVAVKNLGEEIAYCLAEIGGGVDSSNRGFGFSKTTHSLPAKSSNCFRERSRAETNDVESSIDNRSI